jgi:hypothetical protein
LKARKGHEAQITLGEGWRQFAFDRPDLEYLGVIRRGIEIGALAKDKAGAFWQVNGDMRQALNSSKVQALMRSVSSAGHQASPHCAPTIRRATGRRGGHSEAEAAIDHPQLIRRRLFAVRLGALLW